MSISELNVKIEDLETLINTVKEASLHSINLIVAFLSLAIGLLAFIGMSAIKNMVKERFNNFYEKNLESLQTDIRVETKKGLSDVRYKNDLIELVKESIYNESSEKLSPTLINGSTRIEGYTAFGYSKISDLCVLLDGAVMVASPNSVIFNLPNGYRPINNKKIITVAKRPGDNYLYNVEIEISKDGMCSIVSKMYGPSEIHFNMEMISLY